MNLTDTAQIEEMKRYLFQESSPEERETIEDRFFDHSNYFYDLQNVENDLIDQYVRGGLNGEELKRFEQSLKNLPERREKIANARALQTLIAAEKPAFFAAPAPTFWEKIANLFSFKTPLLQYGMGALAVLLAISTGFLLYKNSQINQNLAQLQNRQQTEIAERENALQEKIKQSQEREQELQRELETERGQSEAVNEQLENEQTEKTKLLKQLENLQREKNKSPVNPTQPTLASAFLLPTIISRGGTGEATIIPVNSNAARINFSLQISNESTAKSYNITLDGANIAGNLKPRTTKSGKRVINITLPTQRLGVSEHTLRVDGKDYIFRLKK